MKARAGPGSGPRVREGVVGVARRAVRGAERWGAWARGDSEGAGCRGL